MKLTLIGGGSVRTIYFVESLIKFAKQLGITEVSVMDNHEKKLDIFGRMAKHMVETSDADFKFELTYNAVDAVKNADYIVTTIRVGMDEMRCKDERVALSFGLIGQETTGAGGFSYALRSIPEMLKYCELVKTHSKPDAVIFNFTNPSGLVTQAAVEAGHNNVIGICDNATGIKMDLGEALKIKEGDLFVQIYGLNHLSWANEVNVGGEDILGKLMKNEHFIGNFHQFYYFDRDLIRSLGEIPNGYLYYFYHRERALKNMLGSYQTRGEMINEINTKMFSELEKIDLDKDIGKAFQVFHKYMNVREGSYMSIEMSGAKPQVPIDVSKLGLESILTPTNNEIQIYEGYAGVAFNYIESVKNNEPIDLAVSVANNGAIPFLNDKDVVEISCIIDKNGAKPVKVKEIPESNELLIKLIKRYENLTVMASKEKSIELATEALTVHPLVNSYSLAKELVKTYTEINRAYIGEWK